MTSQNSILIFGATGFIGGNAKSFFHQKGWQVVEGSRLDIDNPAALRQVFINFVSVALDSRLYMLQSAWYNTTNDDYRNSAKNHEWVNLSLEIMKLCVEFSITPFFLGTCLEKISFRKDEYQDAKLKTLQELQSHYASQTFGWIRLFYCYSQESGRPKVFKNASESIEKNEILVLDNPGDAHDFIHISDVTRGICTVIQNNLMGISEIGTGRHISVKDLLTIEFSSLKLAQFDKNTEVMTPLEGVANISRLMDYSWSPRYRT